jgi:hypothetical protein
VALYYDQRYCGLNKTASVMVTRLQSENMFHSVDSGSGEARGGLRQAALIAGLTSALSLAISLWNSTLTMAALHSTYPKRYPTQFEPALLFMNAITFTLPLFYLCLLMERRRPFLSEQLRGLSLGGALALVVATTCRLPASLRSLAAGRDASLLRPGDSLALGSIGIVIGQLSNIAAILVLIALYRTRRDNSRACEVRFGPLRTVAMVSAIGTGLLVIFATAYLFLNLLFYLQYLTDPQWAGLLTSARLSETARALKETGDEARFLLERFGLFVGPYVVWRGYK